jgi:hypothetical protein
MVGRSPRLGEGEMAEQSSHFSCPCVQNPFVSSSFRRCKARPKEICIFISFHVIQILQPVRE